MNAKHPEVSRDRLHQEFETIVADTETLVASIADASGEKALALRAGVEEGLAAARQRLAGLREAAVARASHVAYAADDYVHAHPWRAVGLVAGVGAIAGLVAGLMVTRRSRANGSGAPGHPTGVR
jgi:ElaB/YqjD/DUF883 family membrane-anchored ribosome-binding protein